MASSNQPQQTQSSEEPQQDAKSRRGFAGMDPERQRAIASEGGRAAHQSGNAHQFNSEEAREAGRRGGQARGNGNGKHAGRQQDEKR
ncbi:MAG: KGG domain-containing protein [Polaromonas sp.]